MVRHVLFEVVVGFIAIAQNTAELGAEVEEEGVVCGRGDAATVSAAAEGAGAHGATDAAAVAAAVAVPAEGRSIINVRSAAANRNVWEVITAIQPTTAAAASRKGGLGGALLLSRH